MPAAVALQEETRTETSIGCSALVILISRLREISDIFQVQHQYARLEAGRPAVENVTATVKQRFWYLAEASAEFSGSGYKIPQEGQETI